MGKVIDITQMLENRSLQNEEVIESQQVIEEMNPYLDLEKAYMEAEDLEGYYKSFYEEVWEDAPSIESFRKQQKTNALQSISSLI